MIKKLDIDTVVTDSEGKTVTTPGTNKPIGYPVTDHNFRAIYNGIALPQLLTPDILEPLGWCAYSISPMPTLARYEKAIEGNDEKDTQGIWRQTWTIVEQTDVEKATTDANQGGEARYQRHARLTYSDWTQLPDSPISAENKLKWATYRQTLRDITDLPTFPWDVTWPTPPVN